MWTIANILLSSETHSQPIVGRVLPTLCATPCSGAISLWHTCDQMNFQRDQNLKGMFVRLSFGIQGRAPTLWVCVKELSTEPENKRIVLPAISDYRQDESLRTRCQSSMVHSFKHCTHGIIGYTIGQRGAGVDKFTLKISVRE